ncbi:MAG: cation diffusion facilitator family transporter [Bacteroidia bacterium]|nr:cation diffusion facilitator family transporter [Bacteroidia bacterium]
MEGNRESQMCRVTVIGGVANAALLAFKFVAGFVGHSSAMIADAVHSFSDFITDVIVLVFVRISGKPQDSSHDYGHGKYETLASTIIGLALFAVAIGIIVSGAQKIAAWVKGEDLASPGMLAFWAAIVSIVVKEITYRYTIAEARRLDSSALKANAWHHRSDAFSSIGTAIGIGGAIFLGKRWTVLDPLAGVIVGAVLIKVAVDMVKDGIGDLMEKSLPEDVENEILSVVTSFSDVQDPHNLRTRRIGNRIAIEIHVRMDGSTDLKTSHQRASDIESALRTKFGPDTHVTVHMEPTK